MTKNPTRITIIQDDRIGSEIIPEAVKILDKIANKYNHNFEYNYAPAGKSAINKFGIALPPETVEACRNSNAALLASSSELPELKQALGLFINVRPIKLFPALAYACPLKGFPQIDMIIVSGNYEAEQIGRTAFKIAKQRNKKVACIKSNINSQWQEIITKIRMEAYPDVILTEMSADNAVMELIRDPAQFDVIVAESDFGRIFSSEAGMLTGSLGMLPEAYINASCFGIYLPVHAAHEYAQDIAGRNIANPLALILSAAMMLRLSLSMENEAADIEEAVGRVLERSYRTADVACKREDSSSIALVGCKEMGDFVAGEIGKYGLVGV